RRVVLFAAGVAATALRTWMKSSSGGASSDSNRDGIPRSIMVMLLPSGCAQGSSQLLVGTMSTLSHDRLRGPEHGGRLPDAEALLPEENVCDSVLLRHPGELSRDDPDQVASTGVRFRRPAVDGRKPVVLAGVGRRAEILRAPAPVPQAIHMGVTCDREGPMERIGTTR